MEDGRDSQGTNHNQNATLGIDLHWRSVSPELQPSIAVVVSMNLFQRSQKAAEIIAVAFFALALDEQPKATPTKTRIYQIEAVKLSVSGHGAVRTGGWTEPQLIPSSARTDTGDNSDVVTVHFDFVATKPTGIVTQAITPIAAETTCPAPGTGKTLRVVVHAETNEKDDSIKSPNDPP
jgi:hypothetical protein